MIPPADDRLTQLFVRYWDNALSRDERNELQGRLASDPAARESFQFLNLQAVAAAEHTAALAMPASAGLPNPETAKRRHWSRRRFLGYVGGGVAAGIVATALGRRYWFDEPRTEIRLTATNGEVTLRTADGGLSHGGGTIPAGGIVTTVGPSSSAVLGFSDGTSIALAGDSAVSVTDDGHKVSLLRGSATAVVPARPTDAEPLTLATTEASVSQLSSVELTMYRAQRATEVGVQSGRVTVADAVGEPLEVVHSGEYVTVQSDGRHRKRPVEPTPDTFSLDLSRSLPDGWAVGVREVGESGPVVRPVRWFDPYHQAEMFQIRSDHRWARGFVRLLPKSTIRVRYWVDRPGPSQLCLCVRTDNRCRSDTGVIECNDAFGRSRPQAWQWLSIQAGDMLANNHTPKFGAPWVPFLIIFNTYKEDLGLKIAEFLVE